MKKSFSHFIVALCLLGCKNGPVGQYAIRDFENPLRTHLTNIVNVGVVNMADSAESFVLSKTSEAELFQLSRCEHPILRFEALRSLIERPNTSLYPLILDHLDDTANVIRRTHDLGNWYTTPADYLLEQSRWDSSIEYSNKKKSLIDEVLTKHNCLRSAYTVLCNIEPQEKYYATIKAMAKVERWRFEETEFALYALAKFKKKEDVGFMKDVFLEYPYKLSTTSFLLMKEYPNKEYVKVLETVYYRNMYKGFESRYAESGYLKYYFNALAACKESKSAFILNELYSQISDKSRNLGFDTVSIKFDLSKAVLSNKCKEYEFIIKRIQNYYETSYNDGSNIFSPDRIDEDKTFTTFYSTESIGWW